MAKICESYLKHVISLIAVHYVLAQTQFCTKPEDTSNENAPPLPELPKTFKAKIVAVIVNNNETEFSEQLVDIPNNRATVKLTNLGMTSKLIFDYGNDMLLYVYPDRKSCFTRTLSTDNNRILFRTNTIDGVLHLADSVLYLDKSYGEKYIGQTIVRGILTDHWQSCMYWSLLKANFTLDYYISDDSELAVDMLISYLAEQTENDSFFITQNSFQSNEAKGWQVSPGWPQVPVRAEVNGVSYDESENMHTFKHIYDYVDYSPIDNVDPTEFQTPPGVVCPGRLQTKTAPSFNGSFNYREEIIVDDEILEVDVYYDESRNIVRYTYKLQGSSDEITLIEDFTTDYSYTIYQDDSHCNIGTVQDLTTNKIDDVKKALSSSSFVMRIKQQEDMFYLDKDYTFTGQRYVRGILCDVFISKRDDFLLGGVKYDAKMEYYFLAANDRNSTSNTVVPMQLIIYLDNIPKTLTFQFYKFTQNRPDIRVFDISSCYNSQHNFVISFYGNVPPEGKTNTNSSRLDDKGMFEELFLKAAVKSVSEKVEGSPLRIIKPTCSFKDNYFLFTATLLVNNYTSDVYSLNKNVRDGDLVISFEYKQKRYKYTSYYIRFPKKDQQGNLSCTCPCPTETRTTDFNIISTSENPMTSEEANENPSTSSDMNTKGIPDVSTSEIPMTSEEANGNPPTSSDVNTKGNPDVSTSFTSRSAGHATNHQLNPETTQISPKSTKDRNIFPTDRAIHTTVKHVDKVSTSSFGHTDTKHTNHPVHGTTPTGVPAKHQEASNLCTNGESKTSNPKYLGGAMAGLAISMLLLGLIIGYGGPKIYDKCVKKDEEEATIQLNHHFDEVQK